MKLVVGLGNPGISYKRTYHNVGFITVDILLDKLGISDSPKKECKAEIYKTKVGGDTVLIAKPQTYMNLSGDCVLSIKSKYKIDNSDIFVISDDIDMDKGKVRFRQSGSGGTHNGLRNIVDNIGEDFNRIRIGISRDIELNLADYVLSYIDDKNYEIIVKSANEAVDIILEKLQNE